MFYNLSDAIAFHRKAKQQGKEIYIFPAEMNPNDFNKQDVIVLAFSAQGGLAISGASQPLFVEGLRFSTTEPA
jgi:hypothetical protein